MLYYISSLFYLFMFFIRFPSHLFNSFLVINSNSCIKMSISYKNLFSLHILPVLRNDQWTPPPPSTTDLLGGSF